MGRTHIERSASHPFRWLIDGSERLLLGASREDNLFQIPDIVEHLDALAAAGGNYVRCTMSSRDPGDVWPFARVPDGRYDLSRPEGEYWNRFERFLRLTDERGIIVQIELWDRFDFAREPWQANPFNPRNTAGPSGATDCLPPMISTHPGENENPFFRSPPGLDDLAGLLALQERLIDRLLEATLPYEHILYCIDNETNADEAWATHWVDHLRRYQREHRPDRPLAITEMWDPHDLSDPMHARTWAHPERYDFVDISQGNHRSGDEHWTRICEMRDRLDTEALARPMTMVKIYGANGGRFGRARDAIERFWRALLAGVSALRFHRPEAGLGLSPQSVACIASARLVEARFDFGSARPANELLSRRSENEAFCAVDSAGRALVFFTDGGDVDLEAARPLAGSRVLWLDVMHPEAGVGEAERATSAPPDSAGASTAGSAGSPAPLRLVTPEPTGYWVAVVSPG